MYRRDSRLKVKAKAAVKARKSKSIKARKNKRLNEPVPKLVVAPPPVEERERTKNPVLTQEYTREDMRHTAWKLYMEDEVGQYDIAKAMGISQPTVCRLLKEHYAEIKADTTEMQEIHRTLELEKISRFVASWRDRAHDDTNAGMMTLRWLERQDKLMGLYVNRTELNVAGQLGIQASAIDVSKLDDEELQWLERIIAKSVAAAPVKALPQEPVSVQ